MWHAHIVLDGFTLLLFLPVVSDEMWIAVRAQGVYSVWLCTPEPKHSFVWHGNDDVWEGKLLLGRMSARWCTLPTHEQRPSRVCGLGDARGGLPSEPRCKVLQKVKNLWCRSASFTNFEVCVVQTLGRFCLTSMGDKSER